MKRFDLIPRLRKAFRGLYGRAEDSVKKFSRQTDEVLSEQPIDFSVPSIPYYENLAGRVSFVRVILYMVLFVFVVGTLVSNQQLITYENLYYLAKDIGAATLTAQSQADYLSYPISSSEAEFASYRGGIAVAGSEVVTALSGSGRQTLSVNVAYADPCVRTSEKYCLTFGRGETSFAVYNSFVQVHREITDYPIFDAVVSDSGKFAVLTRSRDYTSEVRIYSSDMERLADYRIGRYVTGLAMNPDGTCLGVTSAEVVGGEWTTTVTLIPLGNRISPERSENIEIAGALGSTGGFITDDRYAVVFSDRLMIFSTDGTVMGETLFANGTPIRATIGRNIVAVLLRDEDDLAHSTLQVFGRDAKVAYTLDIGADHPVQASGGVTYMAFGGDVLFLQTRDKLYRVPAGGGEMSVADISRDVLTILPQDANEILVCTPAYAYRLEKGDFKVP